MLQGICERFDGQVEALGLLKIAEVAGVRDDD
jgi:hypothetical protein